MNHTIHHDKTNNLAVITVNTPQSSASFLNFGARFYQWYTPNKEGIMENILLSLDTPESLLNDFAQFGAMVGPVAGRIKDGQWNGITLEKNAGEHHIHGGSQGWWNQFWDYRVEETPHSTKVIFSLVDTYSGYPGPIHIENTYEIIGAKIDLTTSVRSDSATIVNPTNHAYFNLSGDAKRTIREHELFVASKYMMETKAHHIPTGQLLPITNTGYDFQTTRSLDSALNQLENGLNDAFLLEKQPTQLILQERTSGRKLCITSNRQAVILFSTTGFNDSFTVNGKVMSSELGLAIETQELPDIVHHPEWGSIDLASGITKEFKTVYECLLI